MSLLLECCIAVDACVASGGLGCSEEIHNLSVASHMFVFFSLSSVTARLLK